MTQNITVPDLGGATDVDVIEVLVKVGDSVKIDTPLATLESDKATMDLPSSAEGIIKELKIKTGDKVSQGTIVAVVESAKASHKKTAAISEPATEKKPSVKKEEESPIPDEPKNGTVIPAGHNADVHAGPAVRKLAREFGVNLMEVKSSGPKDRIVIADVQTYVKAKLSQVAVSHNALPAPPIVDFSKFGTVEVQPLSRIKKLSGKNLHRNWLLVPHVTQFGEADITELEDFRTLQKTIFEKQGIKLTPLVFILKAVASALRTFPTFNASLDATGDNLILKKYIHIGVAVDTPDGLVVPVIRHVDQKGMAELAKELSILSDKARKKQLMPNDMQGGTFSISSLGGIGGTAFTPIVNVPEVAILGISKSSIKPIYQNNAFQPRLMLPLSLSYDHRVIDGAEGARFIAFLSTVLSDIRHLLL